MISVEFQPAIAVPCYRCFQNTKKVFKKKTNHAKRKTSVGKNFTCQNPLPLQLPSISPGRLSKRKTQGK